MPVSLRIHVLSYDKSVGNLVVVLSEGQADISQHVIVQPVEPAEARFAPRRFQAPDAQKSPQPSPLPGGAGRYRFPLLTIRRGVA
jgi:hypothetical protein